MLPVVQLELRLAAGTRVVPAQVQGRNRTDEAWRDLAAAVFYRLEREGQVSAPPPLPLHASVRYVRVVPDVRAAPLPADAAQLAVQVSLASLVFAAQGQAPFTLQAGSGSAATSALLPTTMRGRSSSRC